MLSLDRRTIQAQWRNGGPVVTWSIIIACVAVWLVEMLLRLLSPALFSSVVSQGMFIPATAIIRPWTWLTSMFLHAPNVLHVFFNMMALWAVGPVLERIFGHWRFLALYMISGFGGAVGLVLWARFTGTWVMAVYGASGALFGLFAALLLVYRRVGADIRSMLVWMAINFALPVVMPNIAWQAHVGGFIVGGALTWLLSARIPALRRASGSARMWVVGGLVVAVLLALVLLAMPSALVRLPL
ncbi:MAG: rhomboid family intramembrane serine protease [Bifidobacterium sp.]|jgi:membrane associated rhomboid family serine protease|nr:rhomboid family intramembrane serine protease [Bifidobacterium sp.]MCI1864634.1 rhomboid family intramembrane serine protease [Bifidobacterium sp.]